MVPEFQLFEPLTTTNIPVSFSALRVLSSTIATAAIEARASPLNPLGSNCKQILSRSNLLMWHVFPNENLASVSGTYLSHRQLSGLMSYQSLFIITLMFFSTSVNRVFNKLFYHRGRSLYYFSLQQSGWLPSRAKALLHQASIK